MKVTHPLSLVICACVLLSACDKHSSLQNETSGDKSVVVGPAMHAGPQGGSDQSSPALNLSLKLEAGMIAYVRVRSFKQLTGNPSITDSFGGKGYVVENLISGAQAVLSSPDPDAVSLAFGDAVTLIERKDGLPPRWLVSKGNERIEAPEYLLSPNKSEIDYLRKEDRIPDTISYIYDDDGWKVWGAIRGGIANSFIMEARGLALMAWEEGTCPVALKRNAVMFDAATSEATWKRPLITGASRSPRKLNPAYLFFCVDSGKDFSFETVDLAHLNSL